MLSSNAGEAKAGGSRNIAGQSTCSKSAKNSVLKREKERKREKKTHSGECPMAFTSTCRHRQKRERRERESTWGEKQKKRESDRKEP